MGVIFVLELFVLVVLGAACWLLLHRASKAAMSISGGLYGTRLAFSVMMGALIFATGVTYLVSAVVAVALAAIACAGVAWLVWWLLRRDRRCTSMSGQ